MADVIALVDDLFFQAKLRETAKQLGISLEMTVKGEQLLVAAATNPAALVIVDLNARDGALETMERLNQPDAPGNPRRVIGFLSHVQTELAERARAAGCAEVLPRSQFTQNLTAILRSVKP